MYEANIEYKGSFNYEVRSGGYAVNVAFPKKDEPVSGITPSALLLAALGSCIAVFLEKYLTGAKLGFTTFSIGVKSDISKEPPRCFRTIDVKLDIPGLVLDEKRKKVILEFIKNCPVDKTLVNKPDIKVTI